MDIVKKKRGGRPSKMPSPEMILMLYESNTATEIAHMYNVPVATVRYWIYKIRHGERKE